MITNLVLERHQLKGVEAVEATTIAGVLKSECFLTSWYHLRAFSGKLYDIAC